MDELVVGDRQFHDLAGDLRGDFHHIGAHRAVARPWRAHVVLPGLVGERRRNPDRGQSGENRQDADETTGAGSLARRRRVAFQGVAGFQLDAGHQLPQRAMTRTIDETMIT